MRERQLTGINYEINGEAIVDEIVHAGDRFRVKFQGSYWFARAKSFLLILPGDSVRVVGRQNITLLVEKI
jgi:membrane protein implicated in regulation of membrane protease activity